MENQQHKQKLDQPGPIKGLYKSFKSYLNQQTVKVQQFQKKFQQALGTCDKVVLKTTNRFKNGRAATANLIPSLKKYAYSMLENVINQVDEKLNNYIERLQNKQFEESDSSTIQIKNISEKNTAYKMISKSLKLNKLIISNIIKEVRYNYRPTKIIRRSSQYIANIYLESAIMMRVILQTLLEFVHYQYQRMGVIYNAGRQKIKLISNMNSPEIQKMIKQSLDIVKHKSKQMMKEVQNFKFSKQHLIQNYRNLSRNLKNRQNEVMVSSKKLYSKMIQKYKEQKMAKLNESQANQSTEI